jgi:NTP pyrophosphatase (non-canonical NTP hydrolase)
MKEIIRLQKEFDARHGWDWSAPMTEAERLEKLKYGAIALSGEVGEFANELKKMLRDDAKSIPVEFRERLKDELTDVLIYTVKLAMLLGIDLQESHKAKVRRNEEKFRSYERHG